MASSVKMTLMEWSTHIRIAKNKANIHIMDSFKMVDRMASAHFNTRMDQSMRARLRMEKRMESDFQGRHKTDLNRYEYGRTVVILNNNLELDLTELLNFMHITQIKLLI